MPQEPNEAYPRQTSSAREPQTSSAREPRPSSAPPEAQLAPIENRAPAAPNAVYAPKAREVPQAPIETSTTTDRSSVVVRPGWFLTLVIASALGAGAVIYWLLRTMRL